MLINYSPLPPKKQKQTTTSSFFLLLFLRVIGVYFSWDGPNLGILSEPVWPSGKAGKRKDLGSIPLRLSFLFKKVVVCGDCLVTSSITSY